MTDDTGSSRIEIDAVWALAKWKRWFSDEVFKQAKDLSGPSSREGVVTAGHFRQAAVIAARSLAQAIEDDNDRDWDGEKKAA